MGEDKKITMDAQVEIAPGVFKRLGDATRPDLQAAATLAEQRARKRLATAGHVRVPPIGRQKSDT